MESILCDNLYVSKDDFYRKEDTEVKQLRKEYGIKEDAFVVIGVGQVQTRKRFMALVTMRFMH